MNLRQFAYLVPELRVFQLAATNKFNVSKFKITNHRYSNSSEQHIFPWVSRTWWYDSTTLMQCIMLDKPSLGWFSLPLQNLTNLMGCLLSSAAKLRFIGEKESEVGKNSISGYLFMQVLSMDRFIKHIQATYTVYSPKQDSKAVIIRIAKVLFNFLMAVNGLNSSL